MDPYSFTDTKQKATVERTNATAERDAYLKDFQMRGITNKPNTDVTADNGLINTPKTNQTAVKHKCFTLFRWIARIPWNNIPETNSMSVV